MIYPTIMGIRFQIDRLHMVGRLTLIIYKTNIFIMISIYDYDSVVWHIV